MNDETPNSFRIWQKFQRKINFRYNLVFELFQKVGMYSLFEFLRLGNLRMSINFFENEMTINSKKKSLFPISNTRNEY